MTVTGARAQVASWTNPAGGDYSTASNWSTGAVPDSLTDVQFWRSATPNPLTITLGGLSRTVRDFGNIDTDMTLQLGSSTLTASSFFVGRHVVGSSGPATSTLADGTIVVNTAISSSRIGNDHQAEGMLLVGADAAFINHGTLVVGAAGHGTLQVNPGAVAVNGDLWVGWFSNIGAGTVQLESGALTVSGNAYIGGNNTTAGGTGVFNVSNGTANITGTLKVWNSGLAAPNGTRVNLSGGTLSVGSLDTSGNPSRFSWTAGTLRIANSIAIEPGAALGANLALTSGQSLQVSNALLLGGTGGNGTVTQTGGTANVGTLLLGNASGAGGDMTVAGGSFTASTTTRLEANGTLRYNGGASLAAADLQLNGGGDVLVSAGGGKVLTTTAVSIDTVNASRIDLSDNAMIVNYAATSPLATIRSLLITGRAAGAWSGNGISSATASSTPGTALGVAEASAIYGDGGGTFAGMAVDDSAVLVKFTYLGDSDLDGDVDIADLGNLASNWQASAMWTGGDFDYNGSVDVNDLGMLASNWQAGVGSPLAPESLGQALASLGLSSTSVPEPSTAALLACAALLLGRVRAHQ